MGGYALEVTGLRKVFTKIAVNDLTLRVRSGELYMLLGPNGAGKTTTLRMAVGLLTPDAGDIAVCGVDMKTDPQGAKRLMAWAPDEPLIYDKLTAMEYVEFVAGLWTLPAAAARREAEALLRGFDLWDRRNDRCEGFSRGMKQKVALAGALIHDPQLLILDEPLTGLDAGAARQVKDMLQARTKRGATVILTTHILEVAERLADRIGVIQAGQLVAEGTMDDLRTQFGAEGRTLEDVFLRIVGAEVA